MSEEIDIARVDAIVAAIGHRPESVIPILQAVQAEDASTASWRLVPAQEGEAALLFFRAAGDTDEPYGYARPGFFADRQLTERLSTTAPLPGTDDDVHEKVRLAAGATLYLEDDEARRYELVVEAVTSDSAALAVAEVSR